eukprot:7479378-Alexandrium_andersonii.AAC.1
MGFPAWLDEVALRILGALGGVSLDPLLLLARPVALRLIDPPGITRQGVLFASPGDFLKLLKLRLQTDRRGGAVAPSRGEPGAVEGE